MIDVLQKNLGLGYQISTKLESNTIKISLDNENAQDIYIELQLLNEKSYCLKLIQRNKEFIKAEFNNKEESICACALGIFTESVLGTRVRDQEAGRKIGTLGLEDIPELINIMQLTVGDQYFSINLPKAEAINLEINTDRTCHIYYLKNDDNQIFIVKDREIPNAFIVLYNFSLKLKSCNELIQMWKRDIHLSRETEEKIKELYLGL